MYNTEHIFLFTRAFLKTYHVLIVCLPDTNYYIFINFSRALRIYYTHVRCLNLRAKCIPNVIFVQLSIVCHQSVHWYYFTGRRWHSDGIYINVCARGSLIEVSNGRDSSEQSSVLVRHQSSLGKINFLSIVFHLEYTVIKQPNGIRSRMPGNQSSLYIYMYIIIYSFFSLHYIAFLFFVLYCETHFYGHLSHSSTPTS
jgi:hypothetical protein